MASAVKAYFLIRDELCVKDCKGLFLLCKGSRVVVPQSLPRRLLETAHEAHAGIVKMKCTLRSVCYWPKMDRDIEDYVRHCTSCTMFQTRSDHPPLQPIAEEVKKP